MNTENINILFVHSYCSIDIWSDIPCAFFLAALGLRCGVWSLHCGVRASLVAVLGVSSCGVGLVALWHVGS